MMKTLSSPARTHRRGGQRLLTLELTRASAAEGGQPPPQLENRKFHGSPSPLTTRHSGGAMQALAFWAWALLSRPGWSVRGAS